MIGNYILVLACRQEISLQVGRLGKLQFFPGYYLYFGSAKSSLAARVARHMKLQKGLGKLHWHIDFLLRSPAFCIVMILLFPGMQTRECALLELLLREKIVEEDWIISGFGNSDCRCKGHCCYLPAEKLAQFLVFAQQALKKAGGPAGI
ncbi:MAG: GIY-YIG nuclease family protein [bacterium]|nr:GIY-YIG nuclease family protein [bacterium]